MLNVGLEAILSQLPTDVSDLFAPQKAVADEINDRNLD
jgi:hypothetical protein